MQPPDISSTASRYWIIGADQKQYGPVDFAQLGRWIAEGRADWRTLAKTEVDKDWKPLSDFSEFSQVLASAPGRSTYARLTGATEETGDSAACSVPSLPLDVNACFEASWGILKTHTLRLILAAGVVVFVQFLIAQLLPVWKIPLTLPPSHQRQEFALPVWATLVDMLIRGILDGGLFWVTLQLLRGSLADFTRVWEALRPVWLGLVWASVVTTVLISLGLLVLIVPGIYLAVVWIFVFPLIIDQRLGLRLAMAKSRAMVHRQWWPVCGLVAAITVLNFFAVWLHSLLLLISLPFSTGALAAAYEHLTRGQSK